MSSSTHRRGWRWIKRGVLGTVAFLVLAVGAAIGIVHTDWGRGIVRAQVAARLDDMFVGGATLGKLEGSPFGNLVLRDLVINGPDRKPAIAVKKLTVALGLLPLLSHQARVLQIIAEDLDMDLRRDADGSMQIAKLMKPGPKSTWSVALPDIQVRRGHIQVDLGQERMNLDGLTLDARVKMPNGGPIDASLELSAAWRERTAAPLAVSTVVHSDDAGVAIPYLQARGAEVAIIGNHLSIAPKPGKLPAIGGTLIVNAPAAAVARLAPDVRLPDDVAVTLTAAPQPGQPWTDIALAGRLGPTPIWLRGSADLDGKHARGELFTGIVDLTALGKALANPALDGRGAAHVEFDVQPNPAGALPIAKAKLEGWGEVAGIPLTKFHGNVATAGEQLEAVLAAAGNGVTANITAKLRASGESITIEGATVRASTKDPARASGGKAPVHGALDVNLAIRGALKPTPSLNIAGEIKGQRLRFQDVSVRALHVAVNAERLPSRPLGHAHVEIEGLVRQDLHLASLMIDATDQKNGKLAVTVRSHPQNGKWLVDADAEVTPPVGAGPQTFEIDVRRHRVRAGNGADWTGNTGHVEIAPSHIVVRDLRSASQLGKLAVDARYERAGRRQGDLAANVDVTGFALESLGGPYHGSVDAKVAMTKRGDAWDGDVAVKARKLQVDPSGVLVDTDATIALHGRKLTVAADAQSLGLGTAKLALELETPTVITDARAWKKLKREAIKSGQLTLQGVDVRRAAEVAGLEGTYGGRVNGDFQLSPERVGGRLELREISAPQLRGLTGINMVLDLTQPSATELAPSLVATIEGVGRIEADAQLAIPDKLFEPAAWAALGPRALRGANVRLEEVAIDPAMLDRFGVASELRGKLSLAVDVGEAAREINAQVQVIELRGKPLVQPIDVKLVAALDDRAATTKLTVATSGKGSTSLLEVEGQLPGSLQTILARVKQWKANPESGAQLPLQAKATLPQVDAAKLLAVFGRTEVSGGTLGGTIEVGGTLARPTAKADLAAIEIKVPPGRGGKPVRTVKKLAITGGWDGERIKVDVEGVESEGGSLKVVLDARPDALKDGSLTLKAEKLDLMPILAFAPGPAGGAAGQLNADLRVKGFDLRTTQIAGELHLLDARIPIAPAVGTLRRAKIDAVIADHQITLGVDGKLGRGTVAVNGSIALDGAAPNGGKAKISLRKVSPIGVIEPQISADITANLSRENNLWRANLVVDHGEVKVSSDRGEKLKPTGAPDDMRFVNGDRMAKGPAATGAAPVAPIFEINVALHSTHIESEEFRGLVKGKVQIRADGDALALTGGIDADSGDLDLFGRRYYIERAGVHFDGPMDPLLDVRITHDFPEVTTVTQIRGRLSKPELIMSSDPGTYSQGQLLGFLLGGDPGGDPQSGAASDKVSAAGASFVANKLGGYVKAALPIDIDVLRYESATASSSAAVTVGTWLTRTLFLAYRQHLEARPDENQGEGSIEYWITRRIVIQGTAGDRNYNGVDLLWRKRY